MQIVKPDLILDSNLNKSGVHRNDLFHSYYPFQRKTMNGGKRVFQFIMVIINAYIIHKEVTEKRKPLDDCMKSFKMSYCRGGRG